MNVIFRFIERWGDPFKPPTTPLKPASTLGFLFYFVRQMPWAFTILLLLGGAMAVVETALFSAIGLLIDQVSTLDKTALWQADNQHLLWLGGLIIGGRLLIAIINTLVEEQVIIPGFFHRVRWQAHLHILQQSMAFFNNDFSGRIAAKIWQSGQAAGDFMINLLVVIWYIVIYVSATLSIVASLNTQVALLIGIWLLAFICHATFFIPRIRDRARASARTAAQVNGRLVDTYSNVQTVKLFAGVEHEARSTQVIYQHALSALRQFTRTLSGARISMVLISSVMLSALPLLALDLWSRALLSIGEVTVILTLTLRMNLLLNRLMSQLNGLFRNFGTLEDSMQLIRQPNQLCDTAQAQPLDVRQGLIEFQALSFGYHAQAAVFCDLSLSVQPGERIGIVGRSGAGKSTLMHLLLRFYDVQKGQILIDGQNIAEVTQASLRAHIGLVSQDTALLHRSIRENIAYGRPDACDAQIWQAAERAQAAEFIRALRDQNGHSGLDAVVGERGVKLSGGQRQRICIARVLLKDAPILILDEATSALDSEAEAAIQENLASLMQGKTVLAIAHRLSTIASLDRLIVIEQGKIIETGSHKTLLQADGHYAALWRRQVGAAKLPRI